MTCLKIAYHSPRLKGGADTNIPYAFPYSSANVHSGYPYIRTQFQGNTNQITFDFDVGVVGHDSSYLLINRVDELIALGVNGVSLQYSTDQIGFVNVITVNPSTITAIGNNRDVYIEEFTKTGFFQYWRVVYDFSANVVDPSLPSFLFGNLFQFDFEVSDVDEVRAQRTRESFVSESGQYFVNRVAEKSIRQRITWRGITDQQSREFRDLVYSTYNLPRSVWLYSDNNHHLLSDYQLVNYELSNLRIQKRAINWNNITADFTELIG